jgi:tetratricopeptide (TPR) repeat protein
MGAAPHGVAHDHRRTSPRGDPLGGGGHRQNTPCRGTARLGQSAGLQADAVQAHLFTLPEVWLTEVARLVPEVLVRRPDLPRPGPLTQPWQQQHLYEALTRALLSVRQPLLLLLDDLQWCDAETLAWLHYLLRFDPRASLLLVGTVRSEEMTSGHPLTSLLMSLRRDALVTELTLDALSASETADLAAHLTGREISPTVMPTLYQETEGNPLFVVETVRAGIVEKGRADHLSYGNLPARPGSFLPPTIQAVIATRLNQPSPAAREVLNLAAVVGRAFTFNVLAHASTSSEDSLVQGLDELWQRRIIREQGGESYDFSHDKLREGAYTALSNARRRLLHRRVAEALEQIHSANLNAVSGQIATHYEGAGLPQQAVSYYQRAGDVARQLHANAEALAAFQRALALLATFPVEISLQDRWQELAARLHQDVGDIFELMGQGDSARDAYQKAEAKTTTADHIRQASLHRRTAKTWESQNLYKEALEEYRLAELALDEASGMPTLAWWREWIQTRLDRIWLHHMLAQVPEMAELVENTRPIVEQHGTQMQQASFFMNVSLLHLRQNHYVVSEEVLAEAVRALAACQGAGSMNEIAWLRSHLAFCYTWRGDLEEGEKELEAALRVGERTGDVRLQGFCLTYLAIIFRKRGQVEKVRDYSLQALTVAAATHRPQYIGIANANLAWAAWRERKLRDAAEHAQMALSLWRSMPIASPFYPFEWIAICPLLGAALAERQLSAAIDYARALLVPEQERLPNRLSALLEAAIQAWDANQPGTADAFLQQAANLGREMGYF